MKKETFYFPHDYNATNDPKMMVLLTECGLAGVGMYWVIIEILHQQADGFITVDAFKKYIKFYSHFDAGGEHMFNKIEQVLNSSGLLVEHVVDGVAMIGSNRVLDNKQFRDGISLKRSQAGKRSALVRKSMQIVENQPENADGTHVEQVLNKRQQVFNKTQQRKGKEIKGKERKVFGKPSIVEIELYCQERKNNVDATKFFNHYESNGWKIGKNPMKNWHAAIVTWERSQFSNQNQSKNPHQLSQNPDYNEKP